MVTWVAQEQVQKEQKRGTCPLALLASIQELYNFNRVESSLPSQPWRTVKLEILITWFSQPSLQKHYNQALLTPSKDRIVWWYDAPRRKVISELGSSRSWWEPADAPVRQTLYLTCEAKPFTIARSMQLYWDAADNHILVVFKWLE